MGKFHQEITGAILNFIEKQKLFFVATAPLSINGHINLSPKGMDCFKVLGPNKVAYMDLISSGNETSAHTLENGRITFMFCSFEKVPNILRLYGKGYTVLKENQEWTKLAKNFTIYKSTRQIIVAEISKVQISCGYGIPLFDYVSERNIHFDWAEKKGEDGLNQYVHDNNLISLDGLPTSIGIEKSKIKIKNKLL